VVNGTALIIPQSKSGDIALIELNNNQYKVNQSGAINFEAGKEYTITVNVIRTKVNSVTMSYKDWVLGTGVNGDAHPVVIQPSPGSTSGFTAGNKIILYHEQLKLATYTYNGSSWTPDAPLYWENIGDGNSEKLTINAKFVRTGKLNNSQMEEVMLASQEVTRFAGLNLNFSLIPSRIIFELKSDGTFTEAQLASAGIVLPDMITEYNLDNGVFVKGTAKSNVTVANLKALIVPQDKSGTIANITLNDNVYKVDLPAVKTFEAGKSYKIVVNLNKNGVAFNSISYTDWTTEGDITVSATPVNFSASTGTTQKFVAGEKITLYCDTEELGTYNYDGSKWTSSTPLYWENIGDGNSATVILRAKYTRANALHSSQLAEVFIAETTATRFQGISFSFTLVPAKVEFKLKTSDDADKFSKDELENATIEMPGYITEYTLENGVFTKGSATGKVYPSRNSINKKIQTALIIPQLVRKTDLLAVIKIGNNDYEIRKSNLDVNFIAGTAYVIEVTLSKSDLSFSATYTDWDTSELVEKLNPIRITGGETTRFKTNDKMSLFYENDHSIKTKIEDFTYDDGVNKWIPGTPVYWENLAHFSLYKFYAVSTLTNAPSGSKQMDDVMYAEHIGADKFGIINLTFAKKTAKVTVTLKSSDGTFTAADLKTAKIFLPDYYYGGKYVDAEYIPGTTKGDIITTQQRDGSDELLLSWEALIQPQDIAGNNTLIKVQIGDNIYDIVKSTETKLEVAKAYTFNVDVVKSGPKFSATYTDWTNQKGEDLETELD